MNEINEDNIDYILSYQSKVGPLNGLVPHTDKTL